MLADIEGGQTEADQSDRAPDPSQPAPGQQRPVVGFERVGHLSKIGFEL